MSEYDEKVPTRQFDPLATCHKCGSDDLGSTYCEDDFCDALDWRVRHEAPVIHRNCRRCSFEWKELPLDSTRPTHEEDEK
jgi:hypothetical protein